MMELSLRKYGESAHTLQISQTEKHKRGPKGQTLPRRGKYYNIVSLTNTSNIANTADWETCEWTKRANIAAICQKRPSSAKLLFFQQSRRRNCTLASE